MNIWLINPYDELPGEGVEGRYGCLARTLSGRGHEVLWISSSFRHRRKEVMGHPKALGEADGGALEKREGEDRNHIHNPTPNRLIILLGLRLGLGVRKKRDWTESLGVQVLSDTGCRVLLVKSPAYQKNVSVKRLWSQWMWGRRVEKDLCRRVESGELEKPDVILASSPPLEGARAGLRLAKRFGAKGSVDIMDDWPETWVLAVGDVVPTSLLRRRHRPDFALKSSELGTISPTVIRLFLWPWFRLAKQNMMKADAVSAQSHAFAKRARALGFRGDVHVCYLGAHVGTTVPVDATALGTKEYEMGTISSTFSVLYLGAMGRVYDIETVLQAACMAGEKELPWRWTLVGSDPDGKWQARAQELGLGDRVSFPGYLLGPDLAVHLEASDVGLVPMDPRSGVVVPYKAGSYLAAGLPIVNSLPGELSELLNNAGAGVDYVYGNAVSLFDGLKGYADDLPGLSAASVAASGLFEDAFNRDKIYPVFADWIIKPS